MPNSNPIAIIIIPDSSKYRAAGSSFAGFLRVVAAFAVVFFLLLFAAPARRAGEFVFAARRGIPSPSYQFISFGVRLL